VATGIGVGVSGSGVCPWGKRSWEDERGGVDGSDRVREETDDGVEGTGVGTLLEAGVVAGPKRPLAVRRASRIILLAVLLVLRGSVARAVRRGYFSRNFFGLQEV
jgi:hypothetical protein